MCSAKCLGGQTISCGFLGLSLNPKKVALVLLAFRSFDCLVKILKRHVLHFHEAKVNLVCFIVVVLLVGWLGWVFLCGVGVADPKQTCYQL